MPPPRASGAAVAPAAMPSASPVKMEAPAEDIRTLEEMVRIARARGDRILAACLETNVHLVALEPGRIVFRPNAQAPKNLAHDLSRQLQQWTGRRWIVTVAAEGGAPTLAESRLATERARKDAAAQEPFVRAVLDAFPGAEIISVREQESFEPGPVSDEESNS